MSNYLNNIVLRSLNLATVVQPRVPQLFEDAPAPSPVPETSEANAALNTPTVRDEVAAVSGVPASQHGTEATPRIRRAEETSARESATETRLPFTAPAPGPAQQTDVSPASLIATSLPASSQSSEAPVRPASAKTQPISNAEHAASTVGPLWPNTSATTPEQSPLTTVQSPLQSQLLQALSPSLTANVSASQQPLPIRISIGRVDVRAIMPAGPAKAAVSARPKPALSLESYLKQREEGKR